MVGELYHVTTDTLDIMDKLEDHPTWYTRDTLNVTLNSSPADLIECETYYMRNFRRQLLTTETFISEYRETTERRYVPRKDRAGGVRVDIKETNVPLC